MGQAGAMGKCQLCDSHINGRLRDREEGSITGIIGHVAQCPARAFSGLSEPFISGPWLLSGNC